MNEIINLKTMQNDLTIFDQMAVSSAANMKSSFDTQLASITCTQGTVLCVLKLSRNVKADPCQSTYLPYR